MYRSLGNVLLNRSVALLFIDFDRPQRLRILGEATLHDTDLLLAEFAGAQLIVRVRATRIFPNCPRYIHEMRLVKHSVYVPTQHHTPPVPVWKQWEEFRRVLPQSEPIPPRSLSTCGSWNSEAVCSAFSSVLCDEQGSRRIESCVPDYNGNGIYRSLGNVLVNQSVALLFIDFERPQPCDARSDYGRSQCV